MKALRVAFRLVLLMVHMGIGLVVVLVIGHQREDGVPRGRLARAVRWWLGRIPRIAGLRVHVRGTPLAGPVLAVSNHVSWLDIPVLGGLAPVGFLSKAEVRRWPLVGWLAACTGTRFIERGAHGASEVTERIARDLAAGRRMHVFAEGTTTDGSDVRRFHPRLLAAAHVAGCRIQPVAIRYLPTQDGRPTPAPYYGDAVLFFHLLRLLAEPRLDVEVRFLEPIAAADRDRRALADAARDAVRDVVAPSRESNSRFKIQDSKGKAVSLSGPL
jgi:lyso-ornithine lipid O-acyltransferase